MFPSRFFPDRYFPPRYFPKVGAGVVPTTPPTLTLTGTGTGVRVTIIAGQDGIGIGTFDIDYNGTVTLNQTSPQDYTISDFSLSEKWRARDRNILGVGSYSNYYNLGHGITTT